jgi:hypothetical protein
MLPLLLRAHDHHPERPAVDMLNAGQTEDAVLPYPLQRISENAPFPSGFRVRRVEDQGDFARRSPAGMPSPLSPSLNS